MTTEAATEDLSGSGARVPEDIDDESVCAICFENQPFVNLPCSCRINYCSTCWDRALATSVSVRGRAQCPSCRTGFRIEFNEEAACLVFSKEDADMPISDWKSCVYGRARPAQIKLLKDYSAAASAEPARRETSSDRGCEPFCICGGVLEKIDSRTRVIRLLEDTDPAWTTRVADPDQCIDMLASKALVTCDLCEENGIGTGSVWTCRNGPRTLVHPSAYDICERCFLQHTTTPSSKSGGCASPQSSSFSSSQGSAEDTSSMRERAWRPYLWSWLPWSD